LICSLSSSLLPSAIKNKFPWKWKFSCYISNYIFNNKCSAKLTLGIQWVFQDLESYVYICLLRNNTYFRNIVMLLVTLGFKCSYFFISLPISDKSIFPIRKRSYLWMDMIDCQTMKRKNLAISKYHAFFFLLNS
jgi:hypothetical protein